jgi:phosphatidylinositol alpha-1,6-mannosyltransferase
MRFIQSLPDAIKFPGSGNKYLLRKAVTGQVDDKILNRRKQGFVFPFDRWFSEMKVFEDKKFIAPGLLRDFRRQRINYSRLWAVLLAKTRGRNLELMRSDIASSAPRLAFIYLAAFDITGGIEKVNKVLMHCLDPDVHPGQVQPSAISLHDEHIDSRYFPAWLFKGFGSRRLAFLWHLFRHARRFDAVLVGHLNLSSAALLMRLVNPKLKIMLMVHGIEAWRPQRLMQRILLKQVDRIISVSRFTASILSEVSDVRTSKITVIPNCLDPFFQVKIRPGKPRYLLDRYGIGREEKILLTITRLNRFEKYKGYDFVIETLPELKTGRNLRYIIAGKGDEYEVNRLRLLAEDAGVADILHLPGFIDNDELQDHYRMADVFVMPSRKEGFGLVLIEAAAAGIPVVAGNSDGSVEAMQHGKLGRLVNPEDKNEISKALQEALGDARGLNQQRALEQYDARHYQQQFNQLLQRELAILA